MCLLWRQPWTTYYESKDKYEGRSSDTDHNGNWIFSNSFIVVHDTHPLKSHKSAVRVAINHLSTHILHWIKISKKMYCDQLRQSTIEFKTITLILARWAFSIFSAADRCSTRDCIYKNKGMYLWHSNLKWIPSYKTELLCKDSDDEWKTNEQRENRN